MWVRPDTVLQIQTDTDIELSTGLPHEIPQCLEKVPTICYKKAPSSAFTLKNLLKDTMQNGNLNTVRRCEIWTLVRKLIIINQWSAQDPS